MMASSQDPFYIVKDEIQESIDKLQSTFHQWERTSSSTAGYIQLTRELIVSCETIEWQVDELVKANTVAAKDPIYYHIDEVELGKRRRWTTNAHAQVVSVKKVVEGGNQTSSHGSITQRNHQEVMRLPNSQEDDDFISSESDRADRQLLLIRQQDEDLNELSASVKRIGGVGLTIHDELTGQEHILDDLNRDVETTSTKLDFVQKKVALVMKKAGLKGQLMIIASHPSFCYSIYFGFLHLERHRDYLDVYGVHRVLNVANLQCFLSYLFTKQNAQCPRTPAFEVMLVMDYPDSIICTYMMVDIQVCVN